MLSHLCDACVAFLDASASSGADPAAVPQRLVQIRSSTVQRADRELLVIEYGCVDCATRWLRTSESDGSSWWLLEP
jgi:hypothetical protein